MGQDYVDLKFERQGAVAIVTLNRPDVLNALSPGMRNSLIQALDEVDKDDGIKAMILTGAGRGFCSGADVKATLAPIMGTRRGPVRACDGRRGIKGPATLPVLRICGVDKPVIAAVNGVAAGTGLGYALACDIRIASEAARFVPAFVGRGIVPDTGVTYFLPRIVGTARALEILWKASEIKAREAEQLGIVSRVVAPDALMGAAMELADELAKGPSVAIELTKRLVYSGISKELPTHLTNELYSFWAATGTEDFEEGIKSFAEKRRPVFKGQ